MQFKFSSLIACLAVVFICSSCSIDKDETLPGTWDTSDGGTIIFNANGSGETTGSDYFEFDCGTLNGVQIGPISSFTWSITNNGSSEDNINLEFEDNINFPNCAGSMEFPIVFSGKNKATVGVVVLGFGEEVELTR